MGAEAAWLEATDLTKLYGGVRALNRASLRLEPGEIRGLVGANGAGKSTLVKLLTGLVVPNEGGVTVDGRPLPAGRPKESLRAGIASVPQELTVAGRMTVAENVMLGHEPRRGRTFVRGRELRGAAARVLDSLSLDVPVDTPVAMLPLIEQRLVMVARALSFNARLVIFDEPTAAVSPLEVKVVLETIRGLSARGVSVLYVSHRLDEIEQICATVTALRDGRVVAELAGPTHAQLVELLAPEGAMRREASREQPQAEAVLRIRGLQGERLQGVDLAARPGEVVGLAGVAGSGARELLLTVAGAVPFTAGTIELDGRTLRSGNPRRTVMVGGGYLPGNRSLAVFPAHSLRHNVSLASLRDLAWGPFVRPGAERSAVDSLLDRVRVRAHRDAPASSLSGGTQQKALVARWIASGARLLLLDDPTAGVDVATRPELHGQIRALCEAGAAVLLVSTDVDELVELADRVVTFGRGAVTGELAGAELTPARLLAAMTRRAS